MRQIRFIATWAAIVIGLAVMVYMCALPGDLPASVDTTDGLPGTYTANGTNPDGTEFTGTAVITATEIPTQFGLQLVITGSIQRGNMTRTDDRVRVTWETLASASNQTLTGSADYTIQPDGSLVGTWRLEEDAADIQPGEGTITLTRDP